jgi:hypothetical protein
MSDEAFEMVVPAQAGTNGQGAGGGDDHLKRFLDETLDSLLRSAQDSASQLIDRAREAAEAEAALSRQMREQAQQEADRMAAWRAEVEPLVDAVNEKAKAIQMCVREAPQRIHDALAPVSEALADVDVVLGRLTAAMLDRAGNPTGPAGPGGPGGPGGRAFDSNDDTVDADAPSFGTLGEAMTPEPMPSASAEETAEETAEATPVEPAAPALHAVQGEQAAPESDSAEPSADASARWVDWPGEAQDGHVAQAAEVEAPAPEASGDGQAPTAEWADDAAHDEDDAALRSATTQLRRAVTDIDWRDLPSASNG